MTSFLQTAAMSARSNVAAWKIRFPDPADMDRVQPPLFLPPGDVAFGVIAEVKKRSPSRGDIMGQADPAAYPESYARGGAEAVSVVVEEQHFGGSPELFQEVSQRTSLPVLWKDFVVDPFQIRLASALGASAVLLIAGMLSDTELASYAGLVREEGLRARVEVHDSKELERAVGIGADLIGVNNRDLVTLKVDTGISEKLAKRFPAGVQAVSESGIRTPEDVARMADLGFRAVLVGESLVIAEDAEGLLREMVKAGK